VDLYGGPVQMLYEQSSTIPGFELGYSTLRLYLCPGASRDIASADVRSSWAVFEAASARENVERAGAATRTAHVELH